MTAVDILERVSDHEDPSGASGRGQVSVVVPHFGDPEPTRSVVEALRVQQTVLEVIVVDDCSPEPFSLASTGDDDRVRVVRRARNGGFGSAVNTGARAARGPLLLVLNSDVEISPTFVADLVRASQPWMPAVTGPATLSPRGTADPTGRHFPRVATRVAEWLTPLARWHGTPFVQEALGHDTRAVVGAVVPVDWLVGAALLMPLADFLAVDGLDERFYMNSEEVDLQRRLRDRGLPSVYVGTVSLVHEGGGSSESGRRRRWLVDSHLRYARKWGGLRRLRLALTSATLVNLLWNVVRRTRGQDVAPVAVARAELDLIWGPTP